MPKGIPKAGFRNWKGRLLKSDIVDDRRIRKTPKLEGAPTESQRAMKRRIESDKAYRELRKTRDWFQQFEKSTRFSRTFRPNRYMKVIRNEIARRSAEISRLQTEIIALDAEYQRYIQKASRAVARTQARNPGKYLPMKKWQKRKERLRPLIRPIVAMLKLAIRQEKFTETILERARRRAAEKGLK